MSENFYTILEIPETANADEIKKSYRRLSMMYHPDKNNSSNATEKFQKISEAYETLGDAEKKQQYDMGRLNPFSNIFMRGQQQCHSQPSVDDIFSNLFGMPFGQGGQFNVPFSQGGPNIRIFHNGIPVNQGGFVNQSFMQHAIQKPTPIIKHLIVSIDKILTGTTIPVDIERWIINNGNKIIENETLYVDIPKGIDEGEIIILRDKGNALSEECKGDIKLFIKIENNTEFKRMGLDLIFEKTITVKEALCGFMFELKSIGGKVYTINNNSGNIITHGYQKIIPNMGLSRDQHTGNLIIIFNVKFPEKLTEEVLEQLKNIDF
jgi:DnaJ-class molecular chaperone